MRLALRLAIPTLVAGVTFMACASTGTTAATNSPAATPATAAVAIKGFAFSPVALEIAKGTAVTFTNGDTLTHTVTSGANRTKDGTFDKQLAAGAQDTITFDRPGTYDYFCTFHAAMTAKVVVK